MFTGVYMEEFGQGFFLQRLQPMISEYILSKCLAQWHLIKNRHIPTIKDEMSL